MGSFLEYRPWARQLRSRRPFTAFSTRVLWLLACAVLGLLVAVLLLVAELTRSVGEGWRTAALLLAAMLCVVLGLGVAYVTPTYRFAFVEARHLESGVPLVMRLGSLDSEVCTVSRVFTHHGRRPELACIGLVDGREVDWPLDTRLPVAEPRDVFRRLRNRSPSGRVRPVQPSEEVLLALVAIWDTRIRIAETEITATELGEEYAKTFPREWAGIDLAGLLDEAARLNLIRRRRRGLGKRQTEYVGMTGLGDVTLSAELRERGIEIHTDAGEEIPVPGISHSTINNSGIIIAGSPGAAASIGSGRALAGIPLEVAAALSSLAEDPGALAESAAQQGADPVAEAERLDLLRQRIEDLAHELRHPDATEPRLRRAARAAAEVGAAAIAGFLGNAAWGALAAWLGLPPREGGD